MKKKLLSIVVPLYFDEEVIDEFYKRTRNVLNQIKNSFTYELIYVNDGSTDRTVELIIKLREQDKNVKLINLSRNFGHQLAVTAGLDYVQGDIVVVIDSDLQDPPEVITEMIAKWQEGYKVVYGKRILRKGESFFKKMSAKLFYRLINFLSDVNLPLDAGDFRLMDKVVVEALQNTREENRYLRGLISWLGFPQYALPYERDPRYAGASGYSLKKLLSLAFSGLTSFSEKPLQLSIYLGLTITCISFMYIIYVVIYKILNPALLISGWTSTLVAIIFFGGLQLIFIGVLGLYIGRIFREIKKRPLYVVNELHGLAEPKK